jgi:hypothetical protein
VLDAEFDSLSNDVSFEDGHRGEKNRYTLTLTPDDPLETNIIR